VATRTGFSLVGRSLGTAVVLTAAQLGILQGLIVLDWRATAAEGLAWKAAQTWLVFVFAVGVLGGVATVRRMLPHGKGRAAARVGVSICAAIGATMSLPLVWLPLRAAGSTADFPPEVGGTVAAGVGVVVGLILALAGLIAAPIAWGVATTVLWVWSVALASAAGASLGVTESGPPRLGVLDDPRFAGSGRWWLGANLMIVITVVLGLTLAAIARKAGASRLATALSGVAGPVLVAVAYLAAGPATGEDTSHIQAYVASLMAAAAGVLASTAVAIVRRAAPTATTLVDIPVRSDATTTAVGASFVPSPRAARPSKPSALSSPGTSASTGAPAKGAKSAKVGKAGRAAATAKPAAAKPVAPAEPIGERTSLAKIISPDRPARPVPVSPAPAGAGSQRVAAGTPEGSGRSDQPERLRRREREHIDWIKNLVNLPEDPLLKARKKAKR
jgi:hypothetical protein